MTDYVPPPTRDDTSGRYVKEESCHCCGKPVRGEYYSDGTVLNHPDNPCDHGLSICKRKRCGKRTDGLTADERLALYIRQIKENGLAASEERKPLTVKVSP